jgi:hypothetical protein
MLGGSVIAIAARKVRARGAMLSTFTVLKVVGIAIIKLLLVAAALLVTIVWFLTMRRSRRRGTAACLWVMAGAQHEVAQAFEAVRSEQQLAAAIS